MLRVILACLLGLALLAGCAGNDGGGPPLETATPPPEAAPPGTETAAGADLDYPGDRIVLQLTHGGGLIMPNRVSDLVPEVTLWGDGRVVFVASDGVIREGQLAPETVGRLVRAAGFLYDLEPHYQAVYHTDGPSADFTLQTVRGIKTVSVYGLHPVRQQEDEPDPEVLAALRGLWAQVQAALPADAPAYQPDAVCVQTWYSDDEATAEWPLELQDCLTGDAARRAVDLGGLGEGRTFRVGDRAMRVLAVPVLPVPGISEAPDGAENGPGHEAGEDSNLPQQLQGFAEDDTLSLSVSAVLEPNGQYRVTADVTNKTDRGVDLLYDCGSLLHLEVPEPAPPEEGMACPAVHSTGLSAGATERLASPIGPEALAGGREPTFFVVYQKAAHGVLHEPQQLRVTLRPDGE